MPAKKILIAEDEPDTLNILVKKLEHNGYQVMGLSCGRKVPENSKIYKPDLIIMDILMGDTDGYSVAEVLRQDKELEDTPIIFMSAQELEYSVIGQRLCEIGHCEFITKFCSYEDLLMKVRQRIG
ncbi:MAG: response regulator [Candidatus Omnitrophica bacterium]|nr:response regulator [Candidatus Omnitrophota bacterium]